MIDRVITSRDLAPVADKELTNRTPPGGAHPRPISFMKKLTVVALAILTAGAAAVAQQSPLTLWYDQPADLWTDALPGRQRPHGRHDLRRRRARTHPVQRAHRLDRRAPRLRPQGRLPIAGQNPRTALGRQAEGSRRPRHEGVHERAPAPEGLPGIRRPVDRDARMRRTRPATSARSIWTPASPPPSSPPAASRTAAKSSPAIRPTPSWST